MTITISAKESVFFIAGAVLLIALGFTVFAFRGDKTETGQPRTEANRVKTGPLDPEVDINKPPKNIPTVSSLPWQSCFVHLNSSSSAHSNVFNGSNPYSSVLNLSSSGGANSSPVLQAFQDINGDNLPDWIWVSDNLPNGNEWACVYLNNGNGWTKAFECRAVYTYDSNGQIASQDYFGDCAQH